MLRNKIGKFSVCWSKLHSFFRKTEKNQQNHQQSKRSAKKFTTKAALLFPKTFTWTLHLILQAGRRKLPYLYREHLLLFSASLKRVLQPGLPQEAPPKSSHAPVWLRLSPAALFGVGNESPRLTRCHMHCPMLEQKYYSAEVYTAKAERFPLLCWGRVPKRTESQLNVAFL